MQSYNPRHPGVHFLKIIEWSLSTSTRKMLANHVFWRLILFCSHLLLLIQLSVLWLSIIFYLSWCKATAKVNFVRTWCYITNPTPARRVTPCTLKRLHGKFRPRLRGLPGLADGATRLVRSPHLTCKRNQIKTRDYMDSQAEYLMITYLGGFPHLHESRP